MLSFSSSPLGSVSVGSWLFIVDSSISALFGIASSVKKIMAIEATPKPVSVDQASTSTGVNEKTDKDKKY